MLKKIFILAVALPAFTIVIAWLLNSTIKASSIHTYNSSYPPPYTQPHSSLYPAPGGGVTLALPVYPPPGPPSKSRSGRSQAAMDALAYIAKNRGISPDKLRILVEYPTEYPLLGRTFQVVQLLDTRPHGSVYNLFVDLSDGRIEEDSYALARAEEQAYLQKYGKMEKALFERLQGMADNDTVRVAVWLAAKEGESLSEIQVAVSEELAQKYPEVRAALEQYRKPMDVKNPELSKKIEQEYYSLLDSKMNSRVAPVVTELRRRGYTIDIFNGMPSIAATLPKSLILELSKRDDVGFIYLLEGKLELEGEPNAVP